MSKQLFDLLIIASMAVLLLALNHFDLLTKYAKFAMIPLLVYYFMGQFAERKFKKSRRSK